MRLLTTAAILLAAMSCVSARSMAQELTRPDLSGTAVTDSTANNATPGYQPTSPDLFGEEERPDLTGEIYVTPVNKSLFPLVFTGYRNMVHPRRYTHFPDPDTARQTAWQVWCKPDTVDAVEIVDIEMPDIEMLADSLYYSDDIVFMNETPDIPDREDLPIAFGSVVPDWLRRARDAYRMQEDFAYMMMIEHPERIEYAYWDLPEPPRPIEEDFSFRGYLKSLNLPETSDTRALPVKQNGERINWLHVFNIGLQLSQAYVSANWYQGGSSYLAFLGNFMWDVQLNNVYHPNLIFQSTVSYKLSINSTPDDEYHKYSISQDLFQYNLKLGYKAVHNWYYSFLAQFKTQFMHSYPANSMTRSSSFLSPGELNLGLGMTYSKENAAKTLKFSASISPLSYNLKTCIDDKVDHAQFGIKPDRRWVNEIGSNAELTFYAKIWGNTTYTTRLFIFSDYKTFQTDWENTLNFQFSRLFSTQIYAHLRYDTSADSSISRHWRKLMLKEILSVGISYTFSTK